MHVCHGSYIVAYCILTPTDPDDDSGDHFYCKYISEDCYQVCDSLEEAEEVYNRVIKRDDIHSASLTKTIKSTDYVAKESK